MTLQVQPLPLRKILGLSMRFKRLFSLLVLTLGLFATTHVAVAQPHDQVPEQHENEAHGGGGEKQFDAGTVIFNHVADAHDWHFFSIGETHVTLPLPIILYNQTQGNLNVFSSSHFEHGHSSYEGYRLEQGQKQKVVAENGDALLDFSITKNVFSMFLSIIILVLVMRSVAAKYKRNGVNKAPSGLQNAIEPMITFLRDEVAKPNLGHRYLKFMPLLLSMFFFIWINNLLGLIPGSANFTGNVAVTGCLALITFIVMLFNGNKHFWGHLFNPPGVPLPVKFLLVPIEILSLFIKPIALMIRLFANILAGHIIILSIVSMIFIFGKMGANPVGGFGFSVVSIAFALFMFFLELLVGVIQAFIFVNLTAVFIGQAIEEPHHHDAAHDEYHPINPETGQEYNIGEQEIIA